MRIIYRHRKRGTEYELIGFGKMQAENWTAPGALMRRGVDMREVAIYSNVNDSTEIWVRPREEFEDGRFDVIFAEDEDWSGLADEIEQEALNK